MAYIISKDSIKNGESRKLYYIARAYRCKLTGKPSRKIIYSLGLSRDVDLALSYHEAQATLVSNRYESVNKQIRNTHLLPNMQNIKVFERFTKIKVQLEELNRKITELEEIKAEFPECSARNAS